MGEHSSPLRGCDSPLNCAGFYVFSGGHGNPPPRGLCTTVGLRGFFSPSVIFLRKMPPPSSEGGLRAGVETRPYEVCAPPLSLCKFRRANTVRPYARRQFVRYHGTPTSTVLYALQRAYKIFIFFGHAVGFCDFLNGFVVCRRI